jgi:nucleotide-binding universal stress UspA family protein
VDFSDTCKATAQYVRDLAGGTGATVTLLHVASGCPAYPGAADDHSRFDGYEGLRGLISALATFRDEYFNGVKCEIRIEFGSVADRIIAYSERSCCNLIMMPRRCTVHPSGSLAGSALEKVLRNAACAVWTNPQSEGLRPFTGFHSIVCAISPNTTPTEYVNETMALGAVFGAKVSLVCAVAAAGSFGNPDALSLEVARSECPVYVEMGPVGHVVRHVAEIQTADLVVINRRHQRNPGGHEAHTDEIVLESPCPVLCLPTKATAASIDVRKEKLLQEKYFMAAC